MVPSEQVPTPSLHQLPDPGGPLMRISIIGAKPPVHRCSPFPQIVIALCPLFLQFIWHGNRHSRGLQGTFARAMASICVHRAPRTPPDSTPGHICSRDDLQEESQPATHSRQCPIPRFPAIHLARQSPFYVPPRHISSRDGIDLCPSSAANPSRQHSRAHRDRKSVV